MDNQFLNQNTNAPWIPEVIANESLGYLGNYLNLGATVSKDTDLTAVRVGSHISIPRRGVIVAQQKARNVSTEVQRPVGDDVDVEIDQHWYVKIAEEDVTRAVQPGSVLPGYVEDAVIVLAEKIEANLLTHTDEFDNIDFNSATSGDSAVKALGRVRTRMVRNKVPRLAQLYGYVSPEFNQALGEATAYIDPKLIPNNRPLTEGTVGRAKGFDIFEGQMVHRKGSPGWDQNFFYARNALVLASRPLLVPGRELGVDATTVASDAGLALRLVRYYDGDEMGVVVQIDTLFGSAVNDERQGFVLESQIAS
jgi:hypothetical protein